MSKLFLVSSTGDTDLAKEKLTRLLAHSENEQFIIIPLTAVAATRLDSLKSHPRIVIKGFSELTDELIPATELTENRLAVINELIDTHKITQAYVGVPSPLEEELSFKIATHLKIPFIVAYEYMFKPEKHVFWKHVPTLALIPDCTFVVPLAAAAHDLQETAEQAKIEIIGHLSIDKALSSVSKEDLATRELLGVSGTQELVFVSGTTQPHAVDAAFLEAILLELNTGKHPTIQVRLGLHPGVQDMPAYLQTLLEICNKYPSVSSQLKIIFPETIKKTLTKPESFTSSPFFLQVAVNGPTAANAADKVAQAVPGALPNENTVAGKPAFFYAEATPYLPKRLFSTSLDSFFNAKPHAKVTRKELQLSEETAPEALERLMSL